MKTHRAICGIAFLLAPVVLAGCLEVETTTTVHRDGSLRRVLVIKGDSSAIFGGRYTIPIDTTWSQEVRRIDDREFELTAERDFADDRDLSAHLSGTRGETLGSTVSVDETFLWFTTQMTYRETLRRFNPIDEVPITDYISQSEIDRFIRHEVQKEPFATSGDSLSLDDASDRYEEWNMRNVFAAYYGIFLDGVRALNDPSLTEAFVASHRDTLYALFSKIEEDQSDKQRRVFESLLKKRAVVEVYRLRQQAFGQLASDLEFMKDVTANSYRNTVVMPGLILGTNAPTLEGNRAEWKDYANVAFFQDYEMWVSSQVINWWAVVLTAVLVLGGLVVLILVPLRRRRMAAA